MKKYTEHFLNNCELEIAELTKQADENREVAELEKQALNYRMWADKCIANAVSIMNRRVRRENAIKIMMKEPDPHFHGTIYPDTRGAGQ